MPRAEPLKVAIVGAGRMGGLIDDELPRGSPWRPYGHFLAFQGLEDTRVVAVADVNPEKLARFTRRFGFANTYGDYREMIETEKPDIVSDATPAMARADILVFAAEHGAKGVFAEKGLCCSLAEADRIAAALRRHDVKFAYGTLRRHDHGYNLVRQAIARGDIGEPRFAFVYAYTDLIRHHCHTIDMAAHLLGDLEPEWVEGRLLEPGDPLAAPNQLFPPYDAAAKRFTTPEGMRAGDPYAGFFRVGYRGGAEAHFIPLRGVFDIEVLGTEGRATIANTDRDLRIQRRATKEGELKETRFLPMGESPTTALARDLVRAIDEGTPTAADLDVTLPGVEVQFAVAHSHLQGGRRVAVPIQDRDLYIPSY